MDQVCGSMLYTIVEHFSWPFPEPGKNSFEGLFICCIIHIWPSCRYRDHKGCYLHKWNCPGCKCLSWFESHLLWNVHKIPKTGSKILCNFLSVYIYRMNNLSGNSTMQCNVGKALLVAAWEKVGQSVGADASVNNVTTGLGLPYRMSTQYLYFWPRPLSHYTFTTSPGSMHRLSSNWGYFLAPSLLFCRHRKWKTPLCFVLFMATEREGRK